VALSVASRSRRASYASAESVRVLQQAERLERDYAVGVDAGDGVYAVPPAMLTLNERARQRAKAAPLVALVDLANCSGHNTSHAHPPACGSGHGGKSQPQQRVPSSTKMKDVVEHLAGSLGKLFTLSKRW
jgi:hypothetical protein